MFQCDIRHILKLFTLCFLELRDKRRRPKSLFPVFGNMENRNKPLLQEDCEKLASHIYKGMGLYLRNISLDDTFKYKRGPYVKHNKYWS